MAKEPELTINLPYESSVPTPRCEALVDFHIRVDALVNYVGESLLLLDTAHGIGLNTGLIKPRLPSFLDYEPKCPFIQSATREWAVHQRRMPEQLFYSAVIQLASHFEIYLVELANEIYYANEEELLIIGEKQLSTKQIYELGSFDRIRQYLKRKAIQNKLANKSYPKIVETFQNTFHIGIHCAASPATQAKIHHFIEVRNIIVHNDGHASSIYFERMGIYDSPYTGALKNIGDSPEVDFIWFFELAEKLLKLGDFIDAESQKRWVTTACPDWDSKDFDIFFIED